MVNIMPALNVTPAAQTGADVAQDGDFAAALEQKTQQLDPLIPEGAEQPGPVPAVDDPVNVNHELPGDMFDPLVSLPDNSLISKEKEVADDQLPVLAGMSVEPQLAHLQTLVTQMDAAAGAAAAGAEAAQRATTAAAVPVDAQGAEATLENIAQAVLTTRRGAAEGSNAAPTAAALVKQGHTPAAFATEAGKEAGREIQAAPGLPAPQQVEKAQQAASLFKPVPEGIAANAAESPQPSFVHMVHAHTPSASLLLNTPSVAAPVPAAPTPVLTQEMGSIAWQQSLGQQVAMFTRNGIHNAEIRLNPAELGVLKINLRMNSDQASLHFVSENHQVRAALEAAMPQLRTSLAESGINLEASRVDSGLAQSWNGSSHSEWSASGQAAQEDNGRDAQPEEEERVIIAPQLRRNSGINTFV